jgi:hypothetical protein
MRTLHHYRVKKYGMRQLLILFLLVQVFLLFSVFKSPISDLGLLNNQDDPVDEEETWTFVPESINGSPIEPPHLAFRKRKFSKRQDHISQVYDTSFFFIQTSRCHFSLDKIRVQSRWNA